MRWPRPAREPTHKVSALRTLVFPAADIKQPPIEALAARRAACDRAHRRAFRRDGQRRLHSGAASCRRSRRTKPISSRWPRRFLGTPYLWGGKTSSASIARVWCRCRCTACGIPCPRDSDMQERNTLGAPIDAGSSLTASATRRSDLLERPCRHRARQDHDHSRQRVSHGGGDRAGGGSHCAHPREQVRTVTSVRRVTRHPMPDQHDALPHLRTDSIMYLRLLLAGMAVNGDIADQVGRRRLQPELIGEPHMRFHRFGDAVVVGQALRFSARRA